MSESDSRLNERQQKFVGFVRSSPSVTRAAILAGYSERSAGNQGHRLMQNAEVLRKLAELRRAERIRYHMSIDDQADKYEALFHLSVENNRLGTALSAAIHQSKLYGLYEFGKAEARMSPKDMYAFADTLADSLRERAVTLGIHERDEIDYQRREAERQRELARAARIAVVDGKRERIWNFKATMDPAAFEPTKDELEVEAERDARLAKYQKPQPVMKDDETAAGTVPLTPALSPLNGGEGDKALSPTQWGRGLGEGAPAAMMKDDETFSPSPLRGEGWGGGETHASDQAASPPPGLPPQGGEEESGVPAEMMKDDERIIASSDATTKADETFDDVSAPPSADPPQHAANGDTASAADNFEYSVNTPRGGGLTIASDDFLTRHRAARLAAEAAANAMNTASG